jgi:threonine/homoserine/homoserine lactone efflux protein
MAAFPEPAAVGGALPTGLFAGWQQRYASDRRAGCLDQYPESQTLHFFLAFLPPCVPSGAGSPIGQRVVLSAVFMGTALIIFILYGVLAMSTRLPQCPQVA